MVNLVDDYLAEHKLWGFRRKESGEFNFAKLYSDLVNHKNMKPHEVAELTLPEALLFMEPKSQATTQHAAFKKQKVLLGVDVNHYLELARIRTSQ